MLLFALDSQLPLMVLRFRGVLEKLLEMSLVIDVVLFQDFQFLNDLVVLLFNRSQPLLFLGDELISEEQALNRVLQLSEKSSLIGAFLIDFAIRLQFVESFLGCLVSEPWGKRTLETRAAWNSDSN